MTAVPMSLAVMVVGGVGLAQASSDPRATGAAWRRRSSAVAVGAAGAGACLSAGRPGTMATADALAMLVMLLLVVGLWFTAQHGRWEMQRWLGLAVFLLFALPAAGVELGAVTNFPGRHSGISAGAAAAGALGAALACGLVGGSLAAALLFSRRTEAGPSGARALRRLLALLAVMLLLRLAVTVAMAFWPWWDQWGIDSRAPYADGPHRNLWTAAMLTGRYGLGLLLPLAALAGAFVTAGRESRRWACVLLWLATGLAAVGEVCALELARATARPF
jgi:hypothetical protein